MPPQQIKKESVIAIPHPYSTSATPPPATAPPQIPTSRSPSDTRNPPATGASPTMRWEMRSRGHEPRPARPPRPGFTDKIPPLTAPSPNTADYPLSNLQIRIRFDKNSQANGRSKRRKV